MKQLSAIRMVLEVLWCRAMARNRPASTAGNSPATDDALLGGSGIFNFISST
jgi:hypothetical protein